MMETDGVYETLVLKWTLTWLSAKDVATVNRARGRVAVEALRYATSRNVAGSKPDEVN
jgi:hypothetical protein